jgi:lysyl-tRNA synthetase class 1
MSASKGTGLDAVEGSQIMPAEVIRYFVFRAPPSKRLFFDPVNGVVQLMDEFAALAAKENKTSSEEQLLYICTRGSDRKTVSRIPFSLLVASYQAALQDEDQTIETVRRTEYAEIVDSEAEIIKSELKFIEAWLEKRAPEEVKFKIQQSLPTQNFSAAQRQFMMNLAEKITKAPEDADGAWFHTAIYSFKESSGLTPKELFTTLYQLIIAKDSGPRAGWFLSLLPRDWLIKRLRFEA